jgi:hypothetical protein
VDQAVTVLIVGALVATLAIAAFLFGRTRADAGVTSDTTTSSTAPIALEVPSSTDTTIVRRSKTAVTDATQPEPTSDTGASTTAPTAASPTITTPTTPPTTAPPRTTAPPTTAGATAAGDSGGAAP